MTTKNQNKFEYEEKFIVINKKRFDELMESAGNTGVLGAVVEGFLSQLKTFKDAYRATLNKPMDQKYYVVNQDEPYADKVFDLIEAEEIKKQKGITHEEEG